MGAASAVVIFMCFASNGHSVKWPDLLKDETAILGQIPQYYQSGTTKCYWVDANTKVMVYPPADQSLAAAREAGRRAAIEEVLAVLDDEGSLGHSLDRVRSLLTEKEPK